MFDPKIGEAFNFFEEELTANQAGRLSSDQAVILANAQQARAKRVKKGKAAPIGTELRSAEGPFEWAADNRSDWWGSIGGMRFPIDRLQLEAFTDGVRYRLYYLELDSNAWVMSIDTQ